MPRRLFYIESGKVTGNRCRERPTPHSSRRRRGRLLSRFVVAVETGGFDPAGRCGRDSEAPPKAIIAPHAGYIYSGIVAASAFALLAGGGKAIHRVILAGPAHRVAARGVALPDCDAFITPLGTVPIDQQAVDALRQLPQVRFSDEAHRQEHALEVELPFLQVALDQFMIVPMVIGNIAPEAVAEALNAVWGGPETLIVISSDLSHYLPYEDAQRIDADTSRQIENFDPSIDHQQACGALPVNGLLLAARQHGLQVRRLQVLNSGDTAGDRRRVVGYGAFAFFETAPGTAAHAH